MAPTLPSFQPARIRSYVLRLPLFTRIVILLIVVFWILELQSAWNVFQWGALIPQEINLGTSMSWEVASNTDLRPSRKPADGWLLAVYRLNTYPLIHLGFIHAILNTLALAPLLERFEADHGTLLTAAMFVGRTFEHTLVIEVLS